MLVHYWIFSSICNRRVHQKGVIFEQLSQETSICRDYERQKMNNLKKPSVWQVIKSVSAAAIGVQSDKNREEDFQSSTIWPFAIGGILFTVLFVVGLIVLVRTVT